VLKVIESQLDTVVKAEKFDLVLERSAGVVHAADSLDITKRVLNLVNKEGKEAPERKEGKPAEEKKEGGGGK